jgi:hypothetical protein
MNLLHHALTVFFLIALTAALVLGGYLYYRWCVETAKEIARKIREGKK